MEKSDNDFNIPLVEKVVLYVGANLLWGYFTWRTYAFSQNQVSKQPHINGLQDSYFGFKRVSLK
jgi:hypothetical protein